MSRPLPERPPLTVALVARLVVAALVIGTVVVLVGLTITRSAVTGVGDSDSDLVRWFFEHRTDVGNSLTGFGSKLADTQTAVLVAAVAFFVLRAWLGRWYESFLLIVALGGELAIFLTATAIVHRPRPTVPRLDASPPTSSFPSGHTAAATTVYGFLAVMVWRYMSNRVVAITACTALVLLPFAVATSRLYRGAHYPTDVLAGALLAVCWLTCVLLVLLPRRRGDEAPAVQGSWPRHAVLVVNPSKLTDPDKLRGQIDAAFTAAGAPCPTWLETTPDDHGTGQTRAALDAGADLVLVCGGDGTVRACAAELAYSGVPLAILPAGTGNLLARNLGVPTDLGKALTVALTGTCRTIDLGEVDGNRFAVMAGLGFDAEIFENTSDALKQRVGWAAYVVAGGRALRAVERTEITLELDGRAVRRSGVGVLIGNVGTLQAGVTVLDGALPDDGLFDVAVLRPVGARGWLGLATRLLGRRQPPPWELERFQCREVAVTVPTELPAECDGDLLGRRKQLTAKVLPAALDVCVPSDPSESSDA